MTSLIPFESIRDVCVGGIVRLDDDLDVLEMVDGASSSKSTHLLEVLLMVANVLF